MRKQVHSALARAVATRWGSHEGTHQALAEHHYGAEEYGPAYDFACLVAEAAYAQGLHERAAQHYQLALRSHEEGPKDQRPIPLPIRDHAAQSFNAIGKFQEADMQLKHMLADKGLSDLARMDCQRRMAEAKYKQQDWNVQPRRPPS